MLLRLAQPPDPCGSQRLWLEHTVHMLGFEPGPPPVSAMSPCPWHGDAMALGVPVPQPAARGAPRSVTGVRAGYL